MNRFRMLVLALSIFTFSTAMVPATSARANTTTFAGVMPFYFNGYYSGVPYGYGYFNPLAWPVSYWTNPILNGYSYYSYYNYLPFYVSFAAISYSPSADVFGYAFNEGSRQNAVWSANRYCGVADCRPVVWVQGACAVVVTSASTGRLTWAYDNTISRAEAWAVRSCENKGDGTRVTDCVARVWTCSY